MVFDDDFVKNLPPARVYGNPWSLAICKLPQNHTTRQLIEKWFLNLPVKHQPSFKLRLTSLDDTESKSAYYELITHQYAIEEGWHVEYEPELPSGYKPDLLVTTQTGDKFIIEVTTVFDSDLVAKSESAKEEVTQRLNSIKTSFIMNLQYTTIPMIPYRVREIGDKVTKWLDSLDVANTKKRHKKTFKTNGFSFEIEAIQSRRPKRIARVASVMDPAGMVPNYTDRIKSKLDEKAKKFGSKKTGLPLVIVLADGVGRLRMNEQTVDRTLFGNDVVNFSFDGSQPPTTAKARNGYFTPSTNEDGEWVGKSKNVSAVLYLAAREEGCYQMQLFHNPVPYKQFDDAILYKMPQLERLHTVGALRMKWTITNPEGNRIYFML